MRIAITVAALALMAHGALAFQETTVGGGGQQQKAPAAQLPVLEVPKSGLEPGKGLNLQTPGKEIRIPGIGSVGVLPKLDFGLELLYGANEQRGMPEEKAGPDDVQIRGTIKHRF